MNNNDGYMDSIHTLRTQYEADICILLVHSLNSRGYAGSIGAGYESAFCVVRANSAISNYTFPHELGHLYGCRHDSDPGTDPFEYAHGFNWTGKLPYNPLSRKYKTIMSIADEYKYMRVPYFSNPNVEDQLNNPMGTLEDEYCALAIDEYAPILASFETPFTTVGTMSSNETWSGRITVPGDLTVASGVTLTIQSGSEIVFVNGAKILVNGSLDVNGTSSNQAIFDFVSQTSSNGIKIYSSGSADIEYAEIKNAYYGVYCNEGEVEISNSDIKDCFYGVYLYRTNYTSSQPDITNCNIYKTSYDGSGTGIYCNYSSPTIINTNVSNYYTGIGTIYNSSPLLGHYTASGNNKLYDNYKNLHAISSSNPFLGTTSYGGYNTLRDYTNKNLIAQTNCNIYAENNYWGSTNSSTIASGISIYSGCSVDYLPFITWDPNCSSKLPDNKLEKSTDSDVIVSNGELSNIQLLILSGKLEDALAECNTLLAERSSEAETLYALDLMWQIERKMKTEKNGTETDLFADIRNKDENDLSQSYVNLLDAVGVNGKSRISALDNVLQKSGDNATIEKSVIYAKMLYYYNEEMNIEKAKEQYQLLAEKYPNAPITKEALFHLDGATSNSSQNKLNEEIATEFSEMPATYLLFSNYPNPFNPATTISYSLPKISNVSLVI